jgi:hypothetical protein
VRHYGKSPCYARRIGTRNNKTQPVHCNSNCNAEIGRGSTTTGLRRQCLRRNAWVPDTGCAHAV